MFRVVDRSIWSISLRVILAIVIAPSVQRPSTIALIPMRESIMMSTTHRAAMTRELNGVVLAGRMMQKRLVFLSRQGVRVTSQPSKDLDCLSRTSGGCFSCGKNSGLINHK